jgi:MFS family permease
MPDGGIGGIRRIGRYSVVDLEGLASSTVSSRVEALGVGLYQLLVVCCVGGVALCESLEMGAVAPLHSAIARVFGLSDSVRASLPAFTYAGSMAGLVVAGPMGDKWGRKATLMVSLFLISLSMALTAVLPAYVNPTVILGLRFLSGFAGAIGGPSGMSLAVESCPESVRSKVMFAIMFVGSLGYLCEAFAVEIFMPSFGEGQDDAFRAFCFVIATPALLSLPLTFVIAESPCFLAVKGRAEECARVLDNIAWWNGWGGLRQHIRVPRVQASQLNVRDGTTISSLVWSTALAFLAYPWILGLLIVIDSSRSFFMSGSSYLWKDLFNMPEVASQVSPSLLNVIASVSPLIGLLVGERIVKFLGVRTTCFACSAVAGSALLMLTFATLRGIPAMLLCLVLATKLTYGPLGTCICLMKLEAFPTEVRTTIYSFISMCGKLLCLLAPTMVEVMRHGEKATDWTDRNLSAYIWCLIVTSMATGLFALFTDGSADERKPLEDYVDPDASKKDADGKQISPVSRQNSAATSYGSFYNIWTPTSASATPTWMGGEPPAFNTAGKI